MLTNRRQQMLTSLVRWRKSMNRLMTRQIEMTKSSSVNIAAASLSIRIDVYSRSNADCQSSQVMISLLQSAAVVTTLASARFWH